MCIPVICAGGDEKALKSCLSTIDSYMNLPNSTRMSDKAEINYWPPVF